MNISAETVPAGPNFTDRVDPGMKQTFRPKIRKSYMFVFPLGTFNCFIVSF